jgi:hypothetical protein
MPIYTPAKHEIDRAVETAAALAPALWSRLVYAGCILRAGDLAWHGDVWSCRSAADPAAVYAVDFAGCTCPDCASGRVQLHGEGCCAHRLALLLLCDVCLARVRDRLLGATADPAARAAAAEHPGAALLTLRYDGGRRLALCTADSRRPLPSPICQMEKMEGRLGFASERDLAAFARWLAGAGPLSAPVDVLLRRAAEGESSKLRIPPALTVRLATLGALIL